MAPNNPFQRSCTTCCALTHRDARKTFYGESPLLILKDLQATCLRVALLAWQANIGMKPGASAAFCEYNYDDTAGREDRRGIGAFKARLRVWSRGSVSISLVTMQTSLLLSDPVEERYNSSYTPAPAVSLAKARDEQEENNNSASSLAKSQQERGAICEKLFLPPKIRMGVSQEAAKRISHGYFECRSRPR